MRASLATVAVAWALLAGLAAIAPRVRASMRDLRCRCPQVADTIFRTTKITD
jgi:hypothetical protein